MFSPIPAQMLGASLGFPDAVAVAAPSLPPSDTLPALGSWQGRDRKPRREEICAGTLGSEARFEIPSRDGAEPDPSPLD